MWLPAFAAHVRVALLIFSHEWQRGHKVTLCRNRGMKVVLDDVQGGTSIAFWLPVNMAV